MTKQKIVLQVQNMKNEKSRTKAMKIVVSISGVLSAKLCGDCMDIIVVTGVEVDTTNLTILLRKRVGFTKVVSVQPIGKEDEEEEEREKTARYRYHNEQVYMPYYQYAAQQVYMPRQDYNQDLCTIL